jgi:hypothetical protein
MIDFIEKVCYFRLDMKFKVEHLIFASAVTTLSLITSGCTPDKNKDNGELIPQRIPTTENVVIPPKELVNYHANLDTLAYSDTVRSFIISGKDTRKKYDPNYLCTVQEWMSTNRNEFSIPVHCINNIGSRVPIDLNTKQVLPENTRTFLGETSGDSLVLLSKEELTQKLRNLGIKNVKFNPIGKLQNVVFPTLVELKNSRNQRLCGAGTNGCGDLMKATGGDSGALITNSREQITGIHTGYNRNGVDSVCFYKLSSGKLSASFCDNSKDKGVRVLRYNKETGPLKGYGGAGQNYLE